MEYNRARESGARIWDSAALSAQLCFLAASRDGHETTFAGVFGYIHDLQHNQVWQVRRTLRCESAMEMGSEDGRVNESFGAIEGENEQIEC